MPKQFPFDRLTYDRHCLCTLDGHKLVAAFAWLDSYERPWEANVSIVYPASGSSPVIRHHGDPRAQGWTLHARTHTGEETSAMREILQLGRTLGLVHAAVLCEIEDCTIEERQPVVITGWTETRVAGSPTGATDWAVGLLTADRDSLPDVPDADWGDTEKLGNWWDVAFHGQGEWDWWDHANPIDSGVIPS